MRELYFKNLKLEMGMGGRFIVRLIIYIFYGSLTAACFIMLFAELEFMRSAGVFLLLFLIDRLIHADKAEEPLAHMPDNGPVNLDTYLVPSALAILEKSTERTYLLGGNFFYWTMHQCLTRSEIKNLLRKSDVKWRDVSKKILGIIKAEQKNKEIKRASKVATLEMAERLVKEAYQQATTKKKKYIEIEDLFAALNIVLNLGGDYKII